MSLPYNVIIFSFVVYLLYLRFFHLVRYFDIYTKLLINFNLTILYVLAFLLSLGFTLFLYAAQVTGVALVGILKDLPPIGATPPRFWWARRFSQRWPRQRVSNRWIYQAERPHQQQVPLANPPKKTPKDATRQNYLTSKIKGAAIGPVNAVRSTL